MRWIFILILIVALAKISESKGGRGGGGGFKLISFKKAPGRVAKNRQRSNSRPASKTVIESETTAGSKYFNRDEKFNVKDYGTIFTKGLSKNSYIYNNYYRTHSKSAGIVQFLTNALFFRMGLKMEHEINQYNEWNENDDRKWRMTTKAPYFENKIPGKNRIVKKS
jgi:hypothetical protein